MMKKYAVIILICLVNLSVFSQENKVYKNVEVALRNVDSVFILDLSKNKLTTFPLEILKLVNLKKLILKKNKLTALPLELRELKNLEYISIEKNKIVTFPLAFCSLLKLKTLVICRNPMVNMPDCIEYLTELEYIDMWETEIDSIPEGISKLSKLKEIDLRGIAYNVAFQERLAGLLPNTEIHFDLPCNCD